MNIVIGRRQKKVEINENSPLIIVAPFGKSNKNDNTDYVEHAKMLEMYGAHMIQELSTYAPFKKPREQIINKVQIPYGTVFAYEFLNRCNVSNIIEASQIENILKETLASQINSGVDYITVHASLNKKFLNIHRKGIKERLIPITSRAGSMLIKLMKQYNIDNPLHTHFEYICKVCKENNVAISLGSTFRAGAIKDSMDRVQIYELYEQKKLFKIAKKIKHENLLLEGFGHGLPSEFKNYCDIVNENLPGMPITALGPLPIDTAVGLDDIAATVGISFGRTYGLKLVNIVTSKEHISIPTLNDVANAIRYTKLGGAIGDTILLGKDSLNDSQMSLVRSKLLWKQQKKYALFPELFDEIYSKEKYDDGESCDICENNCPHKLTIE